MDLDFYEVIYTVSLSGIIIQIILKKWSQLLYYRRKNVKCTINNELIYNIFKSTQLCFFAVIRSLVWVFFLFSNSKHFILKIFFLSLQKNLGKITHANTQHTQNNSIMWYRKEKKKNRKQKPNQQTLPYKYRKWLVWQIMFACSPVAVYVQNIKASKKRGNLCYSDYNVKIATLNISPHFLLSNVWNAFFLQT